jgi:hypothetical protein
VRHWLDVRPSAWLCHRPFFDVGRVLMHTRIEELSTICRSPS